MPNFKCPLCEQEVTKVWYEKITANADYELILNPNYSFENFVANSNNEFALAASLSVAKNQVNEVNPLFIYGSSGLGKTHLLQAIGNYIKKNNPYLKVMYRETKLFTADFIDSLKNDTVRTFRAKYRNVDVLLIDDIQFLTEKCIEIQNEFFHTFETLYCNEKRIVISSNVPPNQIATLTDRLRERLQWGIVADIQAPALETIKDCISQ